MLYEFRCDGCGAIHEDQHFTKVGYDHEELRCCVGYALIRMVSLPQVRPISLQEPYFNHNVGTWIKDDADLTRQLKRKAERNSELTGTDHNYIPVYPGDLNDPSTMKKLGVGVGADRGESIEHTMRERHRSGRLPGTSRTTVDLGKK